MYALGLGVLKDQTLARIWLDVASANCNKEAGKARDGADGTVTPTQVEQPAAIAWACKGQTILIADWNWFS